jgi:hypothetical protein
LFYTAKRRCWAVRVEREGFRPEGQEIRGNPGHPPRTLRAAVHSLHAADCGSCFAVRFRDIVALGDRNRARCTAAVIAYLLPRPWGSFLRHGYYGFLGCRTYAAPASVPVWAEPSRHHHGYYLCGLHIPHQLRPSRLQHRPAVDCGCCRNTRASPFRSPRTSFFLPRLTKHLSPSWRSNPPLKFKGRDL